MTPPPVQTTEDAINRLDALEASVHETLVALRSLRSDLAGVQTPSNGQWWQVRSVARGADPAETSEAVCIRDHDTGELLWLFSTTLARRPLHHFQPLRRLNHIKDWGSDDTENAGPVTPSSDQPANTATTLAGAAYYSTDDNGGEVSHDY